VKKNPAFRIAAMQQYILTAILLVFLSHSAMYSQNHKGFSWGNDEYGQLGNGDTFSPRQIGATTNWASVSSGETHTLAIKSEGSLWAWGSGGVLGDGTQTRRYSPVQIGTETDWVSVSCGWLHTAVFIDEIQQFFPTFLSGAR
jgi:alpha-tubulin suppressor-like RCC1 family protein